MFAKGNALVHGRAHLGNDGSASQLAATLKRTRGSTPFAPTLDEPTTNGLGLDRDPVIKDKTGAITATSVGSFGSYFIPAQLAPGEAGFGYVNIEGKIPDDATYTFTAETQNLDHTYGNTAPVKISEANLSGDVIVGTGSNQTGATVGGSITVTGYCFSQDGKLIDMATGDISERGDLNPGDPITYSIDVSDQSCSSFLVGASGYFSD